MNNRLDEADDDHQRYNNNQMTADFSSSMQARQSSSQPTADDDDDAATATSSSSPQRQSETTSSSIRQRPPPRRVDHTYRDYSNFPLSELPSGKKTPTNFPSKLHQILSTPEYAHIISWMPHGRAWKIHDKDLLIREVVPKYFVQSKYESFTRQLNGWGYKRLHQSGNDFNAYYHECFLRGLPYLTYLMKRVTPNKGKLLPHVEGEPNFYEIEKQFPLPAPPHMMMMPFHPHPAHHQQPPHGWGGYTHGATLPPYPGYGAASSPEAAAAYHHQGTPPNHHYGLPPPYYGHYPGHDAAAAAAGYKHEHQTGYPPPPYPPYYPDQQQQYAAGGHQSLHTHYSYLPHHGQELPPYGANEQATFKSPEKSGKDDDAKPSSSDSPPVPIKGEEEGEDVPVKDTEEEEEGGGGGDDFEPINIFDQSENTTSENTSSHSYYATSGGNTTSFNTETE